MSIHSLERYLSTHPFFRGLSTEYLELLTGCARNVAFTAGDTILRQGAPADNFYLLRDGKVALEFPVPGNGRLVIDTLDAGDVLGASWLITPHQWHYDARALVATRAFALDAVCLRGKCDADPVLGYDLMKRFAAVMQERLEATQLQLTDMYGNPGGEVSDG
ncbi:MAG: cyclic nucleotide-binding domain-containing protein [Gammaproteobacteria bacterium]|nr:cyclic nucleotide-binding domain-containing protein [Gammaproteobacteria bacterium]